MSTLIREAVGPKAELDQQIVLILEVFGLTQSELGDLFNVRQPSIAQWIKEGVPQGRRASIGALYDLAVVLQREVIAARIPEIVRRPDAWLGDRTILGVISAEGVSPIWAYLARLFRYAE